MAAACFSPSFPATCSPIMSSSILVSLPLLRILPLLLPLLFPVSLISFDFSSVISVMSFLYDNFGRVQLAGCSSPCLFLHRSIRRAIRASSSWDDFNPTFVSYSSMTASVMAQPPQQLLLDIILGTKQRGDQRPVQLSTQLPSQVPMLSSMIFILVPICQPEDSTAKMALSYLASTEINELDGQRNTSASRCELRARHQKSSEEKGL